MNPAPRITIVWLCGGVSTSIVERTCSQLRRSWAGSPLPPLNLPFIRDQVQTPRIFLYHTIHGLLPFSLSLLPDAALCVLAACARNSPSHKLYLCRLRRLSLVSR